MVDFKLENVLVSLHSLKTMGLGPYGASATLFLMNGELLEHSPLHKKRPVVDRTDFFFSISTRVKVKVVSTKACIIGLY